MFAVRSARKPAALRVAAAVLSTAVAGVVVGLAPTVSGPLAPSAATAATAATVDGHRCTITGTPRSDRLVGTSGRDVICGMGGDDTIIGNGGNDLIIGGAGSDKIQGDAGNDVVLGGGGTDHLAGGGGADRIAGGTGADVETGGGGDDDVQGNTGDDDLSGDGGADDLDGGTGFNVCDVPAPEDQEVHCAVDTEKPVVEGLTVSTPTVDVSDAAQSVQVEAHVTDDTGARRVDIGLVNSSAFTGFAFLVSGTDRDGIWKFTLDLPRYLSPGTREVAVDVTDRVGRQAFKYFPDALTVVDTDSDHEMPMLQSMTMSTTSVDVRSGAQPVSATIQVTDDLAGARDVELCAAHAFSSGTPNFRIASACSLMHQTSGTPTDATWSGTYDVPRGAPGGTWNLVVQISDAADNSEPERWDGPDAFASTEAAIQTPYERPIPDGRGVFTVHGPSPDVNPPVLTSLTLAPATVDTSHGAVQVTATIAGTDDEGITEADMDIAGFPGYPDNPTMDYINLAGARGRLVSGSPQDGVWQATFVVPGGTPDGSYFVEVTLADSANSGSWVAPTSNWQGSQPLTPDLAPTGLYLTVANS